MARKHDVTQIHLSVDSWKPFVNDSTKEFTSSGIQILGLENTQFTGQKVPTVGLQTLSTWIRIMTKPLSMSC